MNIILLGIFFSLFWITFVFLIIYIMYILRRFFIMNKYKNILSLFDHFLKLGYEWIYTDQILAYTSSGSSVIPQEEMDTIEINFIKLTFDMMGSQNEKMLIEFFGSRKTVINNMLIFIRKQLADDEISKLISGKQKEANT